MNVLTFFSEEGSKETIITPCLCNYLGSARHTGDKHWSLQLMIACELFQDLSVSNQPYGIIIYWAERILLSDFTRTELCLIPCAQKQLEWEERAFYPLLLCPIFTHYKTHAFRTGTGDTSWLNVIKQGCWIKYDRVLLLAKIVNCTFHILKANIWLNCPRWQNSHHFQPCWLINSNGVSRSVFPGRLLSNGCRLTFMCPYFKGLPGKYDISLSREWVSSSHKVDHVMEKVRCLQVELKVWRSFTYFHFIRLSFPLPSLSIQNGIQVFLYSHLLSKTGVVIREDCIRVSFDWHWVFRDVTAKKKWEKMKVKMSIESRRCINALFFFFFTDFSSVWLICKYAS